MSPFDAGNSIFAPAAQAPARRSLPVLQAEPRVAEVGAVERRSPESVRISVTDRCDFACTYCRPSKHDGYVQGGLDLSAWRLLVRGLSQQGITRFRLTGGEPLLHPGIVELVRMIAGEGVRDLALTTNASRLVRLAKPLREAGLMRLNISIDSLDPERFADMTRGGRLAQVLSGIEAARDAGFEPIKLNVVVLRGVNDDEIERLVEFAWSKGLVPRLLEVMPIAEGAKLAPQHLVTAAELRARLAHLLADEPWEVEAKRGPAKYVRAKRDPALRVGFISGTSDTYCGSCDRLRVSSTGTLRPCLATEVGVEAGAVVTHAAHTGQESAQELPSLLREAWSKKPDGEVFKGCTEDSAAKVSMRAIGG